MSERHPTEEELVLRYYGEAGDGLALDAHLAGCPRCASDYRALSSALSLVPTEQAPPRDDAYGRQVWDRVRPRLGARRFRPSAFAAGGALAASLLLAFWLGQRFPGTPAPGPVVRERVLLVAVGDHLERSRMVLAEISNAAPADAADLQSERQWAGSLVAENRLYRHAATQAGDVAVAGLLDDLERVLAEFAHGPETLSARQLEDLRARIEARGLLFKVKVVEGQVRARARRVSAPKEIS